MRRISFILAILLFAVPVLANVTVSCSNNTTDPNTVLVSYTVVSEPNRVRAFALDITVDKGAVITGVSAYKRGPSEPNDLGYGIFPGSFDEQDIDPDDPNWAEPNYSPLADPCDYPSDTKGGLGTGGITVELGSVYYPTKDNSPNAPPLTGGLLKFTVGGIDPNSCTKATIALNQIRGGIVMTNSAAPTGTTTLTGYTFCRSCPCFIRGDASCDGKISSGDLKILQGAWPALKGVYNPCADFSKDGKISSGDLKILQKYWPALKGIACTGLPGCP